MSSTTDLPQLEVLPKHVAIIMDGNNRWAKQRKLPGLAGHKAGVDSVRAVLEVALQQGIQVVTLFAFSSENWRRPAEEVSGLMELFRWALRRETKRLHKYQVKLKIVGDRSAFSEELQQLMQKAEELTAQNTKTTLVIAANYGGRQDITSAARQLAQQVSKGELTADEINEDLLQKHLAFDDLPDPDLCIRTSGEKRLSNFLLWQLAYTELVFVETFWPDFRQQAFYDTLKTFINRQRRFGGREVTPQS
ncbi:polyprenyl diphosphate synthase [Marinospirillum insulare]|uniref:Ditrans,polycis-undecaprenyl-diphosphate synthase ((2E,6E)-farnesyl-diphosphate specific) n=1 Tax=Marinospirillum insulare TaxID=217169 RepID=A0ABQ6A095_9GAMM|nr:polyprenyl diphosphate synthase [Marinospirillum insulare]GLR63678.1 ditrans,polycis-undecaprenyl-diphosphate synthase [Marinospirillum insulare]